MLAHEATRCIYSVWFRYCRPGGGGGGGGGEGETRAGADETTTTEGRRRLVVVVVVVVLVGRLLYIRFPSKSIYDMVSRWRPVMSWARCARVQAQAVVVRAVCGSADSAEQGRMDPLLG